jgi:hypothetical protein
MNVEDVIKKSRNAKSRINYEYKTRIFAEDLRHGGVKQYMKEHFDAFVTGESVEQSEIYDEASPSPIKDESKAEDIDFQPLTPVETTGEINEFDIEGSPAFKKSMK